MRIVDIITIDVNNVFTIKCEFKIFVIYSIGLRLAGLKVLYFTDWGGRWLSG